MNFLTAFGVFAVFAGLLLCILCLLGGDYPNLVLSIVFVVGAICNLIYYRDRTKTNWLTAGQILIFIWSVIGLIDIFYK
jgi:hypothetical protein